jgi:hypothetical protein
VKSKTRYDDLTNSPDYLFANKISELAKRGSLGEVVNKVMSKFSEEFYHQKEQYTYYCKKINEMKKQILDLDKAFDKIKIDKTKHMDFIKTDKNVSYGEFALLFYLSQYSDFFGFNDVFVYSGSIL